MDNALPRTQDGPSASELQNSSTFGRLVTRFANGAAALSAVAIVLILVLVCIEVALRPFRSSLLVVKIPVDEVCGYLNAAAVFLGLAYTLREGGFIRVELLYERLRGNFRQAARWLIVGTGLVYVAVLLYFTVLHVMYLYQRDVRAVSVIETPEWIPQSVAIVGLAVLGLQLAIYVAHRVRNVP
jgi:TRAP-type C4-dicarboxylate transport system permease small subunit